MSGEREATSDGVRISSRGKGCGRGAAVGVAIMNNYGRWRGGKMKVEANLLHICDREENRPGTRQLSSIFSLTYILFSPSPVTAHQLAGSPL